MIGMEVINVFVKALWSILWLVYSSYLWDFIWLWLPSLEAHNLDADLKASLDTAPPGVWTNQRPVSRSRDHLGPIIGLSRHVPPWVSRPGLGWSWRCLETFTPCLSPPWTLTRWGCWWLSSCSPSVSATASESRMSLTYLRQGSIFHPRMEWLWIQKYVFWAENISIYVPCRV